MPRIVRGRAARNDAVSIWFDIAHHDLAAADRMVDRIDRKIALLAEHPKTGRSREELGPNMRSAPVGPYLIIYWPLADGVEILRIVHGARDLGRLLQEP